MPTIKRNWGKWLDGLRSKAAQAGGASIATNLASLIGSNGIAAMGIPGLTGIGMNWKTALFTLLTQFLLHVGYAASVYVRDNPDPDLISSDTTIVRKTPSGSVQTFSQQTTVKTEPPPDKTLADDPGKGQGGSKL